MPYPKQNTMRLLTILLGVLLSVVSVAQTPTFEKIAGLPDDIREINCILPDAGTTWVGTNTSLLKITSNAVDSFQDTTDLGRFSVNRLAITSEGDVWMGTYMSTLLRLGDTADNCSEFSMLEYMNNDYQLISSMFVKDNYIWFSTSEGNVFKFDTQTEKVDTISLPVQGEIYSLLVDKDEKFWVCTDKGLYNTSDFKKWKKVKGLEVAYKILFRDNSYWVVGRDMENKTTLMFSDYNRLLLFGFWEINFSRWSRLVVQGLPHDYVKYNDIDFDSKGKIWIAYDQGVLCYNPFEDSFDLYTTEAYPDFDIGEIKKVNVQNDDVIWVASINKVCKILLGN